MLQRREARTEKLTFKKVSGGKFFDVRRGFVWRFDKRQRRKKRLTNLSREPRRIRHKKPPRVAFFMLLKKSNFCLQMFVKNAIYLFMERFWSV